jgi:hypothetical protein
MRLEKSIKHTSNATAAFATASPTEKRVEDVLAEGFAKRISARATASKTSGSVAWRLRAAFSFFDDMPTPSDDDTARRARVGVAARESVHLSRILASFSGRFSRQELSCLFE